MASRFIFSEKAESGKKLDELNQVFCMAFLLCSTYCVLQLYFFLQRIALSYMVSVCGVIWCGAFYCKEASCKFGKVPTVNDSNERTAGPPLPSAFE